VLFEVGWLGHAAACPDARGEQQRQAQQQQHLAGAQGCSPPRRPAADAAAQSTTELRVLGIAAIL